MTHGNQKHCQVNNDRGDCPLIRHKHNGYYIMSLETGNKLHALNWTEFTIDD